MQTPLDPAVRRSPRRATGLWKERSALNRGENPSEMTKIQHLSTSITPGSCFSRRVQQQRADSHGPSCVYMMSDRSMEIPAQLKDGNRSIKEM